MTTKEEDPKMRLTLNEEQLRQIGEAKFLDRPQLLKSFNEVMAAPGGWIQLAAIFEESYRDAHGVSLAEGLTKAGMTPDQLAERYTTTLRLPKEQAMKEAADAERARCVAIIDVGKEMKALGVTKADVRAAISDPSMTAEKFAMKVTGAQARRSDHQERILRGRGLGGSPLRGPS